MKDKVNKFLEIEDRVFRAPYNYLKEKGALNILTQQFLILYKENITGVF